MHTLIIPDVHNRVVETETIIDKVNADNVILLGDYFDSFGDESNVELVTNTAIWLSESVKQKNRIHLFGNHDLWYSHGEGYPYCAGNSEFKRFVINRTFKDWHKLKFHCWVDDWLCTHAGLSNRIYQEYKKDYSILELMNEIENYGRKHPLVSLVGEVRGGIDGEIGGILWCDYLEFEDIKGIKQIFGHTPEDKVRSGKYHHCIDTHSLHYGIYNGKMHIKKVKDLIK